MTYTAYSHNISQLVIVETNSKDTPILFIALIPVCSSSLERKYKKNE